MRIQSIAGLLIVGAAVVGCGDDGSKDGYDIDPLTTQQAITSNSQSMADLVVANLSPMEQSKLLAQALDFGGSGADEGCLITPGDGSGADFDTSECYSEPRDPVELNTQDIDDAFSEGIDLLATRVFVAGNVESETAKSVTYLVSGSTFCASDEGPDPDCVQSIDDLELRLYVTSPQPGDANVAVQIGPNKITPVLFEVHQSRFAAEVDLNETKNALAFVAQKTGEDIELPDTMRGRVRAELIAESQTRVTAQVSIVQSVQVSGTDYAFTVGTATPAARLTADGAGRTLEAALDLGSVTVRFPDTDYEFDAVTGEDTEISRIVDVFVAGASAATVLSADSDVLEVTEISLGDETSTLSIDGAQVLGIDLNATLGRSLSATINQLGEDGVDVSVSPAFDMKAVMAFASDPGFVDGEAFMMDDTLQVTLDGAPSPRIQLTGEGLKVIDGQLAVSLMNAGDAITVAAGQCASSEQTDVSPSDSSPGDQTPVGALEIVACN